MSKNHPHKILVIRFSSIGDIVLTTPVLRVLHTQLGAEVHLLTKRSFAGVLAHNPHVARIWTIEQRVAEVLPALKAEGFTAVIDLHGNLRSWQVRWGLWRVPYFAFDKLNWQKWLLTRWGIHRMPDVHIVDRYLAAAAPLGIHNDGLGLDYHIPPSDHVDPAAHGITAPFAALVIGAAHATKRLPTDRLIALCRQLPDVPVVLLGGPEDKDTGAHIAQAVGPHVTNACGAFRLHQSADWVRQSAVVITHDTGLMHIAAALHRPILAIWGNTVPDLGMYPYLPGGAPAYQSFEVAGLPCRPCSKIGHAACPRGHFHCMAQQDIPRIAQAAWERVRQY